jgi:hypothetical protein
VCGLIPAALLLVYGLVHASNPQHLLNALDVVPSMRRLRLSRGSTAAALGRALGFSEAMLGLAIIVLFVRGGSILSLYLALGLYLGFFGWLVFLTISVPGAPCGCQPTLQPVDGKKVLGTMALACLLGVPLMGQAYWSPAVVGVRHWELLVAAASIAYVARGMRSAHHVSEVAR